ncbi:hypothetical protein FJY68_08745 [candidate division WOR-3 bacterium]|uniref:Gfo/Idh/MocA-like oxidoreductase N-terminal domain-containing protein n=1 Tax=candidate division WOR-3 bacterium TaxID=2052148 RepID=A0A938BTI9_UNCW3|nr:hypothetical protein [candidate division WOR-3 bacterium]
MDSTPVGIVGAGRSRNGLGPFLAGFLERAGCRVVAVAGASPERAHRNALDLGQRLGHAVNACRDLAELAASGIKAVVISSPVAFHLEALRVAQAADLPTLCEKPLVDEPQLAEGLSVIDAFRQARVLLTENCQWPFALPALMQHSAFPVVPPVRQVAIGFAPPRTGRAMARGLLPHLLSLIQALAPLEPDTRVEDICWDRPPSSELSVLRFRLHGAQADLAASLHQLEVSQTPPRPFWIEVNQTRFVRRVEGDYSFVFACGEREFAVEDPVMQLAQRFVGCVKTADQVSIDREARLVRQRLQLYQAILAGLEDSPCWARAG